MNRRAIHEPWPKAHRMAPPDLRSDNASYARPLDRAHNLTSLVATKSESLPITSRAGNDRNASPGELDFMHCGMTRRREGCVSAMLTESELSIAPPVCHFKDSVRRNAGCKPTSRQCARLFGLTSCVGLKLGPRARDGERHQANNLYF